MSTSTSTRMTRISTPTAADAADAAGGEFAPSARKRNSAASAAAGDDAGVAARHCPLCNVDLD